MGQRKMLRRTYFLGLAAGAAVLGLPFQAVAADPDVESRIEELKNRTAELIAVGRPALEARSPEERLSLAPVVWRVPDAIVAFKDCADCPGMVVIPAGEFTMGRPHSISGQRRNTG